MRSVSPVRSERAYRLVFLVGGLILVGLLGYGQANVANLTVQRIDLLPSFFLASAGDPVSIQAIIVNTGAADAQGFNVRMKYRLESESELKEIPCLPATCNNITLPAGRTHVAIGTLDTRDLSNGRYIIRVEIEAGGVPQSSQLDDFQETLLLIGIVLPEFHPTSLTFSPPSPVSPGTQLTVRVRIENTGKPANPDLDVRFEYCLENPACSEFTSQGFLEGNGIKRLTPIQTFPLSQNQPLDVTNVLDTTNLPEGRYLFRVSIQLPAGRELDPDNNEISTRLTLRRGVVGPNPPRCQLAGDVITLGRGVGPGNLEVLYVGVKDAAGKTSLHAFKKDAVDQAPPNSVCPEIGNSPLSLPADISSFTLDQDVKVLYIGLTNGQMILVNIDKPETLVTTSRVIGTAPLLSLSSRLAGSRMGDVFIGSQDGNLYRMSVTKDASGNISSTALRTCARLASAVNVTMLFQGQVYFGAGTSVRRMGETQCDGRFETLPTAIANGIRSLAVGRVKIGTLTSPRILVGTGDGKVYLLNIFGQQIPGKSLFLDLTAETGTPLAITALAVNDGAKARADRKEAVYAGTSSGSVHIIDLREHIRTCSFATPTRQSINVLAVARGQEIGNQGLDGLAFAGSEDANLYVINAQCESAAVPQGTTGPIRAEVLLGPALDAFGFVSGVTAFYGGGNGLYRFIQE